MSSLKREKCSFARAESNWFAFSIVNYLALFKIPFDTLIIMKNYLKNYSRK